MISAQEAYRIGLVNEIVSRGDLIARAEAILTKIAATRRSPSSWRSRRQTRVWTRAKAKACCSKPRISASAPRPTTTRGHVRLPGKACPAIPGTLKRRSRALTKGKIDGERQYFRLKVVDLASFMPVRARL